MFARARRACLLLALLGNACASSAQDPGLDSLIASIKAYRTTGTLADTVQAIRYNRASRAFTSNGNLDSALWASDRSIAVLDGIQAGTKEQPLLDRYFLQAYKLEGIAYFYGSDYPKALTAIQQFQRTAERMGSVADIGASYNYMSYCFRGMGDSTNARNNALRAIDVLKALPEGEDIANAYTGLGSIYADANMVDSALYYNHLALAIYLRTGNLLNATNTRMNIAEIWSKTDRFDSTLVYMEQARPGVEEMQEASTMAKFHGQMGRALLAQGRLEEAKEALARAETLAHELDNAEDLGHIYDLQAMLAARQGAYTDAFNLVNLGRASMLQDLNVKKAQELTEARMTFEHEREKARTESELGQQRRFKTYALIGGGLLLAIAVLLLMLNRTMRRSRAALQKEKEVSDGLLLNILPDEVAGELKRTGEAAARQFDPVTVLFTDFVNFTGIGAMLSAAELVEELNTCFKAFDGIIAAHGLEKIKTIGDAYMAAGGLNGDAHTAAVSMTRAALEMQDFIERRKTERDAAGLPAFHMRAGVHSGPVVAGIVGVKKFQYDIWGDTVNTAKRMESSGGSGQVNLSEATYSILKDAPGFTFVPRGKVLAKGKGEMEMYFVRYSHVVAQASGDK